jgi:hypothetical protein
MEQTDLTRIDNPEIQTHNRGITAAHVSLQACPACGNPPAEGIEGDGAPATAFVYALGRIEPRFPTPALEKEFAQVLGRAETSNLTDRQAAQKVLLQRQNRYLARLLCWVMKIEGLDTYILQPRDPTDFESLIDSMRAQPTPMDVDVAIGMRGPIAPPSTCNGLTVPIVLFDQIYSFDRDSLLKAIPRPEKTSAKEFAATAEEIFDRLMQMADNAGATDEHRALNYLAVKYHSIYTATADAHARNGSLTSVNVLPSPLSGVRKIVEVIFSYTNRATDVVERHFARVDVTEEFPFLVTKLSPYYGR